MTSRSGTSSSTSVKTGVSVGDQQKIEIARVFLEAFNAHDLSIADRVLSNSYVFEGPGSSGVMDKDQGRAYNQTFLTAFPDLHFEVSHAIAQGDYVVLHWTATGTHSGPLVTPTGSSLPATNRTARVSGCTINEIKNGQIARAWVYWDTAGLLSQLGATPPI